MLYRARLPALIVASEQPQERARPGVKSAPFHFMEGRSTPSGRRWAPSLPKKP